MANPSRKKGSTWEVELLPRLRSLFGNSVHRAPPRGTHDYGDFVGVPFLVEAKSTKAPKFLEWARTAGLKAASQDSKFWCVIWHGDRRMAPQELVVLPLELFESLVDAWHADPDEAW